MPSKLQVSLTIHTRTDLILIHSLGETLKVALIIGLSLVDNRKPQSPVHQVGPPEESKPVKKAGPLGVEVIAKDMVGGTTMTTIDALTNSLASIGLAGTVEGIGAGPQNHTTKTERRESGGDATMMTRISAEIDATSVDASDVSVLPDL